MKRTLIITSILFVALIGAYAFVTLRGDNKPNVASTPTPDFNDTAHSVIDVTFSQMMIQHHKQAIEMAKLARASSARQEIATLAKDVEDNQSKEIELLTTWLVSWKEDTDIPTDTMPGKAGHDMGATVPGMIKQDEFHKLTISTGIEFDKIYLEQMIKHHEGEITMARDELDNGQFGPARKLASQILVKQTEDIERMRDLLNRLKSQK